MIVYPSILYLGRMEPLISVDNDDIPRIDSGLHLSMTGHPTLRRGTELPGLRTPQLCLVSLAFNEDNIFVTKEQYLLLPNETLVSDSRDPHLPAW